jgi:hypothetical protein
VNRTDEPLRDIRGARGILTILGKLKAKGGVLSQLGGDGRWLSRDKGSDCLGD